MARPPAPRPPGSRGGRIVPATVRDDLGIVRRFLMEISTRRVMATAGVVAVQDALRALGAIEAELAAGGPTCTDNAPCEICELASELADERILTGRLQAELASALEALNDARKFIRTGGPLYTSDRLELLAMLDEGIRRACGDEPQP